jgi:paraquat-inducible protein B
LAASLTQVLKKIEQLPIEQIGNDLRDSVAGAKRLINSSELEQSIAALNETLNQAQTLVKNLNSNVAPQAARTLKELQVAARSIKVWAEYLERHPEALIRGKSKSKRR